MRKPSGEKTTANYPLFGVFGSRPRQLTHEEAIDGTADQRIESVWRYLIRRSAKFIATLKIHERSNFDVEDILMELWVEVKAKDALWEPSRGRYITYVGRLVQRHLSGIRDRTRTVESPRNSTGRMVEYEAEVAAGTITGRRAKTFDDIRRSAGEFVSITSGNEHEHNERQRSGYGLPTTDDTPPEDREARRLDSDAVTWGLMALTPFEAAVMGSTCGLWGKPGLTIAETAEKLRKSKDAVKKAKDRSAEKIKQRLYEMGHPAVASDN